MWEDTSISEGKENGNNGPVYWRSCPEFSHLATYNPPFNSSSSGKKDVALKDRIHEIFARASSASKDDKATEVRGHEEKRKEVQDLLTTAFLAFLSRTLGFATETYEIGTALGMYGLDSLSAVGVQYWVWRGACLFFFPSPRAFFSLISSRSRLHSRAIAVFSNLSDVSTSDPTHSAATTIIPKEETDFSRYSRILHFSDSALPFPLHQSPPQPIKIQLTKPPQSQSSPPASPSPKSSPPLPSKIS